jgi:hypothetical protein
VVECMTKSKPCSSGRCVQGLAKVLSQASRTFFARVTAAMRSRSTILSIGLVGVSSHTRRVLGRIAAASAAASVRSAYVVSIPADCAHQLKQPPRTAVNVVADYHVRIFFEAAEHGRGSRHAGGESKPRSAAFEIGNASLECHARRVLSAPIFKALVNAGAGLRIGRGRIDRRHHRAGRRIVLLTGMDAARGEVERIAVGHFFISFARCGNNRQGRGGWRCRGNGRCP